MQKFARTFAPRTFAWRFNRRFGHSAVRIALLAYRQLTIRGYPEHRLKKSIYNKT
jgi:hypothetical protein